MKTIRVGLVGAGCISKTHMKAFSHIPGVEVKALCSRDQSHGKAFCKSLGVPELCTDLDEMLSRKDIEILRV